MRLSNQLIETHAKTIAAHFDFQKLKVAASAVPQEELHGFIARATSGDLGDVTALADRMKVSQTEAAVVAWASVGLEIQYGGMARGFEDLLVKDDTSNQALGARYERLKGLIDRSMMAKAGHPAGATVQRYGHGFPTSFPAKEQAFSNAAVAAADIRRTGSIGKICVAFELTGSFGTLRNHSDPSAHYSLTLESPNGKATAVDRSALKTLEAALAEHLATLQPHTERADDFTYLLSVVKHAQK